MARLMSVSHTAHAVRDRRKTVTRRLGWWEDKHGRRLLRPGDRLTLCEKVMGRRRKDGTLQPLVRLTEVEVVDVRREPLKAISFEDVQREGFDYPFPSVFVEFFCRAMRCTEDAMVTRIEWHYFEEPL